MKKEDYKSKFAYCLLECVKQPKLFYIIYLRLFSLSASKQHLQGSSKTLYDAIFSIVQSFCKRHYSVSFCVQSFLKTPFLVESSELYQAKTSTTLVNYNNLFVSRVFAYFREFNMPVPSGRFRNHL